jgi:hypothetical protein
MRVSCARMLYIQSSLTTLCILLSYLQAAAGWPLSEILDRPIAQFFGAPSVLDEADRVPALLNGGLDRVSPVWWGFCVGMTAAIDLYGVARSRSGVADYFPGNLGFVSCKRREEMQLL